MKVCYKAGAVTAQNHYYSIAADAVEIRVWFLTDDIIRIRAGFDGRVHKDEFYGTKVLGEKDNLHISIELQRGRIMYIRIYESDY